MINKFKQYIFPTLMGRHFHDNDELHLYLLSLAASLFCFVIHIYMFVFFLANDLQAISLINLLNSFGYVLCLQLIRLRKYTLSCLIITIEVSVYTLLMSRLFGIDNYIVSFYLLVMIMQVVIPYGTTRLRQLMIAMIILSATGSIALDAMAPPIVTLPEKVFRILTISNIYITILGILVELIAVNVVQAIVSDFEESQLDELKNQAYTDPLTTLLNRRYADIYFSSVLPKTPFRNYCVAMLDIDDFKSINDTYGHDCGDEILRYLASFLQNNLRKSDLVFRWGGEEFLIVLSDLNLPEAYMLLEKIRLRLSITEIPTSVTDEVHITITAGVAALDHANPMASIKASDENLYKGKRKNKNIVVA